MLDSTDLLRKVVQATNQTTGRDYFLALTRTLADAFGVRYCFVTECLDSQPRRVATLAFWAGDGYTANIEYDVLATPCEAVLAGESCVYGEGVQALFPDDRDLVDLGAESYAAAPLVGAAAEVIGHLVILDDRPFNDGSRPDLSLLEIFAARAAAELERERLESHRRKLQSQVLHVQKLESLGVLAGGIAHDFNNLLCGILGHVDLALMRDDLDSQIHGHLREIQTAAKRSAELANQMLAYSGKGRFVVTRFDPNQLIEDILDLLSASIGRKARIELDPGRDLPELEGDASQIRQVVMNLVINASDAIGEEPGRIILRTGVFEADRAYLNQAYVAEQLAEGDYLFIEVEDDGCGMDEDTRRRLFDPFFTTKKGGRGLGLAALIGIVRGHHGAARVTSRLGRGSTVRVLFPVDPEPARAAAPGPADAPAWQGGGTILLVDDEAVVRLITGKLLESLGFDVLTADSGHSAIEVFRRHGSEIRAVMLDMMMPELDGLETFRELKRLDPGVKVLLASGYTRQSIAASIEKGGLAGFLQKPFRRSQLDAKLREILS